MIGNVVKGIIPAITALVALKLTGYFQALNVPRHIAIIAAACVAAVVALIAHELIGSAKKNSRFVRKLLDRRARFEGDWFIETDPGSRMPYGAISIDYNADGDVYTYSGAAYDSEGREASEWTCDDVQFNLASSRIKMICRSTIKGLAGEYCAYANISFKKVHLRRRMRFMRGTGYFIVIEKPEMQGGFSVERIDRRFVKRALGVREIATKDDMAKVVNAYDESKRFSLRSSDHQGRFSDCNVSEAAQLS
jgi:hypothetical protein